MSSQIIRRKSDRFLSLQTRNHSLRSLTELNPVKKEKLNQRCIRLTNEDKNVKLSLYQAVKAHRVVRRRGSQMTVRLSALGAGRPLPLGRSIVLICVSG
jgi:hypothetical protein